MFLLPSSAEYSRLEGGFSRLAFSLGTGISRLSALEKKTSLGNRLSDGIGSVSLITRFISAFEI